MSESGQRPKRCGTSRPEDLEGAWHLVPCNLQALAIPGPGCTLGVVFDPACPHCPRAAEPASYPRDIGHRTDRLNRSFLRAGRPYGVGGGVGTRSRRALRIRAVPAAFVIRSSGEIGLWVAKTPSALRSLAFH